MTSRASILVTGGAGFVGSHFVREACDAGSHVVVVDDLSAGSRPVLPAAVELVEGDIADRALIGSVIDRHRVTACAHFAGKIAVAESIAKPELYFEHNLVRARVLLDVVSGRGVGTFLFSSTAAIYGDPAAIPIDEQAPAAPISPYGGSKLAFERELAAYGLAHGMRWAALRYFNAAGAHPDGSLRENHQPETHLIPLVIDAVRGDAPPLTIFGDDYPTRDGTCIRDYVHVCDLARAHLLALDALEAGREVGATNLGSGQGASVREVLEVAARVIGHPVPHAVGPRRAGDPPVLLASIERAATLLGWRPERSALATLIEDALRARGAS